jgi:transposase
MIARAEKMEHPWRDEGLMRTLYLDELMSQNALSELFDCSISTVGNWLDRHGIRKRTPSEAAQAMWGTLGYAPTRVQPDGHIVWESCEQAMGVHRLLAAAHWGTEVLEESHIHHKNGIPWDNRIENLEVLSPEEHHSQHRKVDGLDRIRVAELYENGGLSSRKLADYLDHDITAGTVLRIHTEFFGGDAL